MVATSQVIRCQWRHERTLTIGSSAPTPMLFTVRPNQRLLLGRAHVLKELGVVRLAAPPLRASARLASGRVARSRNAVR